MSSFASFEALWEESKAQHQNDAAVLASRQFAGLGKSVSCWRHPTLVVPALRRQFMAERNTVCGKIKEIVVQYVPQILGEICTWQMAFNQWERENSGPNLCGSGSAITQEQRAREKAQLLSDQMRAKLQEIQGYDRHFYPIENPAKMVKNPYPGYLTTERAQNYCRHLIQSFNS